MQIPDPPFVDDSSFGNPPPGGYHWREFRDRIIWCGDANRDGQDDRGGGTNIAFTYCQSGPRVRLFTFILIEHVPTSDITFHIVEHGAPSNPDFWCPLVTLCDGLAFTKVCVNDRETHRFFPLIYYTPQAVINQSGALPCKPLSADVPSRLRPASWSAVKSLYR